MLGTGTGRLTPAYQVVRYLLTHVRPALEMTGDTDPLEFRLSGLLARGNGAQRQRRAHATCTGSPTLRYLNLRNHRNPKQKQSPVPSVVGQGFIAHTTTNRNAAAPYPRRPEEEELYDRRRSHAGIPLACIGAGEKAMTPTSQSTVLY